jgi:diguanylate cyclase (GGDEF)-like protein
MIVNHPPLHQDIPLWDPLTGVYSRAFMNAQLQEEIERARRYGESFTLLLLDLDHFKSVNDAFGHSRGDQTLAEFSQRLHNLIRSSDLIFRYGGDEFVLLLIQTNRSQALVVARRLLEDLRMTPFSGEPPLALTLSIGVAVFPDDGQTVETLFEVADRRHYQAKRAGRDRVASEELPRPSDNPLQPPSRLIEREQALETVHRFLGALSEHQRGVLQVSGPAGAGRSRLLDEIRKTARLRGYAVLDVRSTPALRARYYGALAETQQRWEMQPCASKKQRTFTDTLRQSVVEIGRAGLVITVDDAPDLDRASLSWLRELFFSAALSQLALVYAIVKAGSDRGLWLDAQLQVKVALAPLSQAGLQIWVRHGLEWEASAELLTWLHRQTGGLPGRIQRGLLYLVKHQALRPTIEGWVYSQDLIQLPLAERLAQQIGLPPHNLPDTLPDLVGREEEIFNLKALLRERRLVTLLGPGGIGKTRLALQVAAELVESFAHGVYFVPLAPLCSADLIVASVAEVLGFSFSGPRAPKSQLIDYVRAKEVLLVLDNLDHLSKGVGLLGEILAQAPGVKLLVTSQERLNLSGETCFDLQGLPFPGTETNKDLESYSAVQLFLTHARRVCPDFSLSETERPDVVRICRLVEGMPLGIELAAAWVQTLSCREIATEIENNLAFLSTDRSDLPKRHQSMQAVIDAFWKMFSEPEHSVLRQLSVFRGGFMGQAAHQVAGASPFFLDALVMKAFLRKLPSGRFEIHELLRQYAAARLRARSDERAQARDGHSEYYAAMLHKHARPLQLGERRALEAIGAEIENVRVAWRWAVDQTRISLLNQSLKCLADFYRLTGLFEEGALAFGIAVGRVRSHIEQVAQSERDVHLLLGRLLIEQASCLELQGKHDQAMAAARESVALAQANEAIDLEAMGCLRWGRCLYIQGNYTAAWSRLNRARLLSEMAQLRQVEADSLHNLGNTSWSRGDYDTARAHHEQSLCIYREIGDRRGESTMLNNLGNVSLDQGDIAQAQAYHEQALRICREIGDRGGEACMLGCLGLVSSTAGDYAQAKTDYEQALHIAREIGARRGESMVLFSLGQAYHHLGDDETAQKHSRQASRIAQELGDRQVQASALTHLGHALLGLGHLTEAATVYRQALTLRRELGQSHRTLELHAGLACVFLAQNSPPQALDQVEQVLRHIESGTLNGVEEPFQVYLTCYRVLRANQDPRAKQVLNAAHRLLQERAFKIADEELRRKFLNNVAAHREIVHECRNDRD